MTEQDQPLKRKFTEDLESLRNSYPDDLINTVGKYTELLIPRYRTWNEALVETARKTGLAETNPDLIPMSLESFSQLHILSILKRSPSKNIVLGIAGPGAVGKETLETALGFPKVINTTTRLPRSYEVDGVQYHFVDKNQYDEMVFVQSGEKPGRGWYGIQKSDIEKALTSSKVAIVEQGPNELVQVNRSINKWKSDIGFVLIYVLPPTPILIHLAARLAGRCNNSGEPFDERVIESTLGQRQIDEFMALILAREAGVKIVYVVNDKVDRAIKIIKSLV